MWLRSGLPGSPLPWHSLGESAYITLLWSLLRSPGLCVFSILMHKCTLCTLCRRLGVWSYAIIIYLLCNSSIGDKELELEYQKVYGVAVEQEWSCSGRQT